MSFFPNLPPSAGSTVFPLLVSFAFSKRNSFNDFFYISDSDFSGCESTRPGGNAVEVRKPAKKQSMSYHLLGHTTEAFEFPLFGHLLWTALSNACPLFIKVFVGSFKFQVGHYLEVEEYLRQPYIFHGYRKECRRKVDCFRTWFRMHNETINIWTHLLGAMCAVMLAFATLDWLAHMDVVHRVMFILYLASAFSCMALSSLYHTLMCHSKSSFDCYLALDWAGISVLIGGSEIPIIFYAMYCQTNWLYFYLGMITFFTFAAIGMSVNPKMRNDKYKPVRICVFAGTAFFGSVPILHMLASEGVFTHQVWESIMWVGSMYLSYGIGAVVYITHFPERAFPGKFDHFFSSHQIWHLFIILAAWVHFKGIYAIFEARMETEAGQCLAL